MEYLDINNFSISGNGIPFPNIVEYVSKQRYDPSDFEFEKYVDFLATVEFFNSTWSIAFAIGAIYIGGIFYLQHYMRDRKPLELKWLLVVWNLCVGIFSLVGCIRAAPELLKFVGNPNGFYESICVPNFSPRFSFWAMMFGLSKVPELFDTVFVVLRKKPLEALQWYHHVVTMVGCWICAAYLEPVSRYMVIINFGVHGIMYPYFALKVAGVNVPRFIAKIITTCQFTQMVICMFVNLFSAYFYLSGSAYCHRHVFSLWYVLLVNVSFIMMFGDLFVKLVIRSSRVSRSKKVE